MSKNNLREHLSWLLKDKPVVPAYITPPPSTGSEPSSTRQLQQTTDVTSSVDIAFNLDPSKQEHGNTGRAREVIVNQPPAKRLKQDSEQPDMARLQSATGSARKRGLLSRDAPATIYDRSSRNSRASFETAPESPLGRGHETTRLAPAQPPRSTRDDFRSNARRLASPRMFRTSSPSTAEEYGEPKVVWTPHHARRAEPETRGKKRKSNEREFRSPVKKTPKSHSMARIGHLERRLSSTTATSLDSPWMIVT